MTEWPTLSVEEYVQIMEAHRPMTRAEWRKLYLCEFPPDADNSRTPPVNTPVNAPVPK